MPSIARVRSVCFVTPQGQETEFVKPDLRPRRRHSCRVFFPKSFRLPFQHEGLSVGAYLHLQNILIGIAKGTRLFTSMNKKQYIWRGTTGYSTVV